MVCLVVSLSKGYMHQSGRARDARPYVAVEAHHIRVSLYTRVIRPRARARYSDLMQIVLAMRGALWNDERLGKVTEEEG